MQGRNLLGNWSLLLFLSTDTKLCCPSPNYFIPLQETERLQLTNFGSPISSLTRKQLITPLPVITKKLTNLAASHFQTCICWKVSWEVCFLAEEVFCEVSICMILQETKVYVTTRKVYTLLTTFWNKISWSSKDLNNVIMWISWMNAHFGIILVVNKERCLLSCHKLGTKKKFWVPMRNQTSGLQILYFNALPLSHREFMVSKVHYKVHNYMTRVLHTVCISDVNSNFKLDFLVFCLVCNWN